MKIKKILTQGRSIAIPALLLIAVIACGGSTGAATGDGRPAPAALEGNILSDMGFRPAPDGFSFSNYNNAGVVNLTDQEMFRLFGDGAFEVADDGGKILSPTAREWMEVVNTAMHGGHCEGLAVSSLLFYNGRLDPRQFGGQTVHDLSKDGNERLQREIAFWWATQTTTPTSANKIQATPAEIVDLLIKDLTKTGSSNPLYDLHIYKNGGGGGHAITPYAVRALDADRVGILCYDNNHPGQERVVEVDRAANTWTYSASRNPDEEETAYFGDASSLTLMAVPAAPRLQTQDCPFDDNADFSDEEEEGEEEEDEASSVAATSSAVTTVSPKGPVEIWLDGDADLLITDTRGRRLGFVNGRMVNEIPGASFRYMLSAFEKSEHEPVYVIPSGIGVSIALSGADQDEPSSSDVTIFGSGFSIEVNEVTLERGQTDVITFSPDGKSVTYRPSSEESPDLVIAFRTPGADYEFEVGDFEVSEGGSIEMGIEYGRGRVRVRSTGSHDGASLALYGYRLAGGKEDSFENDDITLERGETGYLYFKGWEGAGKQMRYTVDVNGDGKPDRNIQLEDEDLARD